MFSDSIANHPEVLAAIVGMPLLGILAAIFRVSFRRIARWYLYVAVFAVDIVLNSIFFPFIGGKDYFFRFAVELSLIFFLFSWAFEMKAGELKALVTQAFKKPLAIAVSAFGAAFLLACAFADDAYAAFWSNYERGEGGFQMAHYIIFFLLLVLLLKTEAEWKNMFRFSLVAAGLMILYGIGGNLTLTNFIGPWTGQQNVPSGWVNLLIGTRFQGSLGNAEYVGAYLLFSMFFTAYLWLRRKETGKMSTRAHVGYGALFAVFFLFFFLSQTRGAFLGLGLAILAMVVYFAFAGTGALRKWSMILTVVVILLGGTVFALRNSSFIQSLPGGRLIRFTTADSTVQHRFYVWGEAWQGFLARPIFGWGPENFTTVYDKYFDIRFFDPSGSSSETWFDRAHSVYFDYLSETGIIGLLSYLSIFGVVFWSLRKRPAHHEAQQHEEEHAAAHHGGNALTIERGIILALPVAYLGQGIALFDVLPMYVSLFTFLGFAYYYFYGQNR